MHNHKIIPEERFNGSSNFSLHSQRFKDLARKSFYSKADRSHFTKHSKKNILINGNINKVVLTKISYVHEILPKILELHLKYGHIAYKALSKKIYRI